MDIYDLTPRTIDVELVWVRNTSNGTDYVPGTHTARISWPIKKDDIEGIAPQRSTVEIRDKLWPGGYLGMPPPALWHYVNIYVYDENNSRQFIGSVKNGNDPV